MPVTFPRLVVGVPPLTQPCAISRCAGPRTHVRRGGAVTSGLRTLVAQRQHPHQLRVVFGSPGKFASWKAPAGTQAAAAQGMPLCLSLARAPLPLLCPLAVHAIDDTSRADVMLVGGLRATRAVAGGGGLFPLPLALMGAAALPQGSRNFSSQVSASACCSHGWRARTQHARSLARSHTHACSHAHTHARTHAHTHARTHTCSHARMLACMHARILHTHTYTHTQTPPLARSLAAHKPPRARKHTLTHARTHARTHAHTHARMHAPRTHTQVTLMDLRDNPGARKKKVRVGRGTGSGVGKQGQDILKSDSPGSFAASTRSVDVLSLPKINMGPDCLFLYVWIENVQR